MRTLLSFVAGGIGALLALGATPVVAHHAFNAEFDANRPVKFRGTVTKMEWVNTHAWIHIAVKKPDGTMEDWMIEAGTPNTLFRRGLTKQSLQPGMEVIVDGYHSKDGALRANRRDPTLLNVQRLVLVAS